MNGCVETRPGPELGSLDHAAILVRAGSEVRKLCRESIEDVGRNFPLVIPFTRERDQLNQIVLHQWILRLTELAVTREAENRHARGHRLGQHQTERFVVRQKRVSIQRRVNRCYVALRAEQMNALGQTARFNFPIQLVSLWAVATDDGVPTLGQTLDHRQEIEATLLPDQTTDHGQTKLGTRPRLVLVRAEPVDINAVVNHVRLLGFDPMRFKQCPASPVIDADLSVRRIQKPAKQPRRFKRVRSDSALAICRQLITRVQVSDFQIGGPEQCGAQPKHTILKMNDVRLHRAKPRSCAWPRRKIPRTFRPKKMTRNFGALRHRSSIAIRKDHLDCDSIWIDMVGDGLANSQRSARLSRVAIMDHRHP